MCFSQGETRGHWEIRGERIFENNSHRSGTEACETLSAGFCVTKDGLLADVILRGIFNFLDVVRYDFMHTAFQDGFMSNAMWLLCKSVFEVKYGRSNDATPLLRFLRELQFPQSRADGRRLHILFSEKLMAKHALPHMFSFAALQQILSLHCRFCLSSQN